MLLSSVASWLTTSPPHPLPAASHGPLGWVQQPRQSWVVMVVAAEAGLTFQLLFLSGNQSLPMVQSGGPRGTRCLPTWPDTISSLPAFPVSVPNLLGEGSIFRGTQASPSMVGAGAGTQHQGHLITPKRPGAPGQLVPTLTPPPAVLAVRCMCPCSSLATSPCCAPPQDSAGPRGPRFTPCPEAVVERQRDELGLER